MAFPTPRKPMVATSVVAGPPLEVIATEGLGFLSLGNDAKVQLTSAWRPKPSLHASLLSIASRRGLVAAAAPDGLVVATTDSVRKAFLAPKEGDSNIRSFQPQLSIPLPRLSQVAFTADENYLIVSAEQGGGLAIYEVEALLQGSTTFAFQLPTNNEPLRAMLPNHMEAKAELCAVVTEQGNLLMANMKTRNFITGPNGSSVFLTQISCIAWSAKGKQLLAGLGDGTLRQLVPEGEVKAQIPRPAGLDESYFVVLLSWIDNFTFMTVHISTAQGAPQARFFLYTRAAATYTTQEMTDPVNAFGNKSLPHYTAVKLSEFLPALQELLILSSTSSIDIGLVTRSKVPLATGAPAGVFTTTELADDARRITLPMGVMTENPTTIGTALDLSSKEPVYRPIPSDEMEQSLTPVPGYWLLNEEGILSVWWIIYNDSVRAGTVYTGISPPKDGGLSAAVPASASASAPAPAPAPALAPALQPTQPSAFGTTQPSAFGNAQPTATPTFGAPSILGSRPSPWGSQPQGSASALGASARTGGIAFGQPSVIGQAPGTLGATTSVWGSAPSMASGLTFEQSGFAKAAAEPSAFAQAGNVDPKASPWATATASNTGGFASYANTGGFASLAPNDGDGGSIFVSSQPQTKEVMMDDDMDTSFPPASATKPSSSTPFGAKPFQLVSSFRADTSAKDDGPTTEASSSGAGIMSGLANTLEVSQPAQPTSDAGLLGSNSGLAGSTTSTSAPAPTIPSTATAAAAHNAAHQTGGLFATNKISGLASSPAPAAPSAGVKVEPTTPGSLKDLPAAPLPPESTSKETLPFEYSSSSSVDSDSSGSGSAPSLGAVVEPPSLPRSPAKETLESSAVVESDVALPPDPIKDKEAYAAVDYGAMPDRAPRRTPGKGSLPPPGQKVTKASKTGSKSTAASSALKPQLGLEERPKSTLITDLINAAGQFDQPSTSNLSKPVSLFASLPQQTSRPTFELTGPMPSVYDSSDDDGHGSDGDRPASPPLPKSNRDDDGADDFSEGSGVDVGQELGSIDGVGGTSSTASQSSRPERGDREQKKHLGKIPRSIPAPGQSKDDRHRSPSPGKGKGKGLWGSQSRTDELSTPQDARREQLRKARAQEESEMRLLVDEDDEHTQQLLNRPVEPTLVLDEFMAHSGPLRQATGDDIPTQVELVYRDINSMIDTLGMNSRALKNFIAGHAGAFRQAQRTKLDLANADDWTIGELVDLNIILTRQLADELENARVVDAGDKIAECQELLREVGRYRKIRGNLQNTLGSRNDPEQALANRLVPLTAEQAALQNELRRDHARFTARLAKAEESLSLLKAKMVAAGATNRNGGPSPTLEAIMRTISKVTAMVQDRSGEVDILESQMRQLRFTAPATALNSSTRSQEDSTLSPQQRKLLLFSPDRSFRDSTPPARLSMRQSLLSASVGSSNGAGALSALQSPLRKTVDSFSEAERYCLKEKRVRRAAVLTQLRTSLSNKGPGVWGLEND